jgi:hypothetical protein
MWIRKEARNIIRAAQIIINYKAHGYTLHVLPADERKKQLPI